MLREKVLNTWEDLKDTILGNQQYQLGKLLRDFRITSFASNLTTEQVVLEIKQIINRERKKTALLTDRINSLKREVNKEMYGRMLFHSDAETAKFYQDEVISLKNKINSINSSIDYGDDFSGDSDEDGPTIEEVD